MGDDALHESRHADGGTTDELPNLTHFLVSNRAYGATSNAGLPNFENNDYPSIARAMGLDRVFEFRTVGSLDRDFAALSARMQPGTLSSCSKSSHSPMWSRNSSNRRSTGRS